MNYKNLKNVIFRLVLIVPFLLAFDKPMYIYDDGSVEKGWMFFVFGWLSLFDGNFAWFANIPFLIAFVMLNRQSIFVVLSAAAAFFLGLTIFDYHNMGSIDSNKSEHLIIGLAAYLWFSTILMVFLISVINFLHIRKFNNMNYHGSP
ncbi:MAG: hypothetical protein RR231_13085 [Acinetobacter sp.]